MGQWDCEDVGKKWSNGLWVKGHFGNSEWGGRGGRDDGSLGQLARVADRQTPSGGELANGRTMHITLHVCSPVLLFCGKLFSIP